MASGSENVIRGFAVLEKGGKWTPFEFDAGELKADEVEIRVISCGICHTDQSMAENAWGMTQYPLVAGHEVYGEIIRVGSGVTSRKVGERVGVGAQTRRCSSCRYCRVGEESLCDNGEYTVIGRHGGFAEKVRAQESAAIPVPKELEGDAVGPLFCGGGTVYRPIARYARPEFRVGVIGIGGLGSMAVQFLKHYGCHVTAFTSSEAKRKSALELGAHATISSVDEKELTAAAGTFDLIISTVNVKLNWNLIIGTLAKLGRLQLVGAVLEPLDISTFGLLMGHKTLGASPVSSYQELRDMLDFAARHKIEPQVRVFPFSQINEAFEELKKNLQGRIVLKW